MRRFKDADGNYLWQPSLSEAGTSTLLGYPVTEAEDNAVYDVVTDEELRMALGHFARPKDGLIQYRELLTRLLDTPVPLLQPRVLFKVCGDLGVVAVASCRLLLWLYISRPAASSPDEAALGG